MNLGQAEKLALDLMGQHKLLEQGWIFAFDRAVRRLGRCNYKRKLISLGEWATSVNDEAEVRETCLHEIAHALTGYWAGHGIVWQAQAKLIGCTGKRVGNIAVPAPRKWAVNCLDCTATWKYYRKPSLHPCAIHKCQGLLQRIGYQPGQPWHPVSSNLKVEAL